MNKVFQPAVGIMTAMALFLTGFSSHAEDPSSPIDPARLSATVKTLASDEFQGRAPVRREKHSRSLT